MKRKVLIISILTIILIIMISAIVYIQVQNKTKEVATIDNNIKSEEKIKEETKEENLITNDEIIENTEDNNKLTNEKEVTETKENETTQVTKESKEHSNTKVTNEKTNDNKKVETPKTNNKNENTDEKVEIDDKTNNVQKEDNKETNDKENEQIKDTEDKVSELAGKHYKQYNASKTQHAVNYLNNKIKQLDGYDAWGGKAIVVTSKPTNSWFSYSYNEKLDGLATIGCTIKVYIEDEYVYNNKGEPYLYDTKAYIYTE